MGDGLRTIHLVTGDEALLASGREAVSGLDGWEFLGRESVAELEGAPPAVGDVILLDAWLQTDNVYEGCRRLLGKTRCRTYVIASEDAELAAPIARFCGATGALLRPLSSELLREALEATGGPRPPLPQDVEFLLIRRKFNNNSLQFYCPWIVIPEIAERTNNPAIKTYR